MKKKTNKIYHNKKELFLILFNLAYIVFVPTFKLVVGVVTLYIISTFSVLKQSMAITTFLGIFLWAAKDFVTLYYER